MSSATKKAIVEKLRSFKESFNECAELIDSIVRSGRL